MLATNNFTCLFATIYNIEMHLSLEITSIIETRNAIIFILKLEIIVFYFLIKLLRSIILVSLARMQRTILLNIN